MFTVGESVYKYCEQPNTFSTPGYSIACPFQSKPMNEWCKQCLISRVSSLQQELRRLGETATLAADRLA